MRMDTGAGRARQIEEEQQSLDVMYARLDANLSASLSAHARAMAAPVEGPEDLYARDLEVSRVADNIRQLRSAERSLCFGRIDGAHQGKSLHVGRIGLRTDAGKLLLVDWRAEAARPFYSATMVSPLGLHRRRHLRLSDREVVDVSDEILDGTAPTVDDVVGDGPLVSALSGARTGRMREAAATLQTEQDDVVRSPHRGIMVVDGGPGTGKTIVALHRAAYVLYAFPSIADRRVLVYGPNRRFIAYISDVLPSLGENDVQMATLPDLIGVEALKTEPDQLARASRAVHSSLRGSHAGCRPGSLTAYRSNCRPRTRRSSSTPTWSTPHDETPSRKASDTTVPGNCSPNTSSLTW
jgi:DNA helicase IV